MPRMAVLSLQSGKLAFQAWHVQRCLSLCSKGEDPNERFATPHVRLSSSPMSGGCDVSMLTTGITRVYGFTPSQQQQQQLL